MHVYFSGIGGTAIGPLGLIAKDAGYTVSGSDARSSRYVDNLRAHGISDIHIGQSAEGIAAVHQRSPIDWFVYTSALPVDHPELLYCREHNIRFSKRDEFLNAIIKEKGLDLIAVAGTHGKTTTTAMIIWLLKSLGEPVSYSVGAKLSFGDMGSYDPRSWFFVYECDEFDRNFLAFEPKLSVITGIAWDHHEIFKTELDYQTAFKEFIRKSEQTIIWSGDVKKLDANDEKLSVESTENELIDHIKLLGKYVRRDGWLAIRAVQEITGKQVPELIRIMNQFPSPSRRFEQIADNLYSDYAHTPEKIRGAMDIAREKAGPNQPIVVVYEPLTDRRMHYTGPEHEHLFDDAAAIYWVPSYLAREDADQKILTPDELIAYLSPEEQAVAKTALLDQVLKDTIQEHLDEGHLVLALSGGGGGSLDEWLRTEFKVQ